MKYTVHQTKTNLSRLLGEASVGKEVIIARDQEPVAKIIAIGSGLKKRFPVGSRAKFLPAMMRLRRSATESSMNSASLSETPARHPGPFLVVQRTIEGLETRILLNGRL